ncbi:ATP-dependent RNA helicase DEAH12, chloroplastic-like [Mercurialis annua]|uniref:ATP-dependent RNA helicase DEAH12, chloroplastic-like n=1 Tax=Mercurialis annua TaxID=3986 RepID=UPI0021604EAE|nr:ATP-dependent RNA helicase DEAH12, chloroplastic-like [Mercurialis annua]
MIPDSTRHRTHHPPPSRHRQFRPPQPLHHRPLPHHRQQTRLFLVKLISTHHTQCHSNRTLESIVSQCTPKPFQINTRPLPSTGSLAATLLYRHQIDAVNAFIFLWEKRLLGDHLFTPIVDFGINDETHDKIRVLFQLHCKSLLGGEFLEKLEWRVNELSFDIDRVSNLLKKPKGLRVFNDLGDEKDRLVGELDGIVKRIEEFKFGVRCVLDYLEKKDVEGEMELRVLLGFRNGKSHNWSKLHCLLLRECRRVEDGLPIYGSRREILRQIHSQQVIVLIGETGSGKSTQLVQYLADSGVAASGSILCTQPRKIAALSLSKRVGEETSGCYDDYSVVCFPTYSSDQLLDSKAIYMTDHCLMRHLMRDKTLSGVSCIIVDEAHERSLDTDLLLALIKELLIDRRDLRLVIMSATVDATKISEYFFGCGTFRVMGRNFPVDIEYVPGAFEGSSVRLPGVSNTAPYVFDVVKKATEIHQVEKEGAVLAFLTSQLEVEWACEKFHSPSAIVLPLHGRLSHEEQSRVFQNYPGKRKVIFATNLAETSLTIPGVKFVIDSGMAKESKFEPSSGMNILRVSKISQSSANQRAGRAGRTEPGKCYRLYSEVDYQSMALHQEPEICKVHLGIAVLRILALGIKNVLDFDFIDAPSEKAVDMAIKNLKQLGAVTCKNNVFELTSVGHYLVKLGIEPRLGKIILDSCHYGLRKEGVVLAAVMSNASSIFCRVGTDDDKLKSDCLKVQFCHQDGDLFTLLTVYREWEDISLEDRNKWCWNNSINAKTMRKCNQTVQELENCLRTELNIIIPSYWVWKPYAVTGHDRSLKKIILSSLTDNVAMYSGYDRLGYEVALSGEYVQLHPSCSLQAYSGKPHWVVFAELLSASSQYLVCVTAIDFDSLSVCSPPSFDISKMQSRKLQARVIKGFSSTALKRFCGKANHNLLSVLSRMQTQFMDKRIGIEISVDNNEVLLYASLQDMEKVYGLISDALEYEMKWLNNECLEKCLYNVGRAGASPPFALFGAGAEIRHLELENRCLSVDVFLSDGSSVNDKEILTFLENSVSGVCGVHRFAGSKLDADNVEKWGKVTFLTPEAARKALELNGFHLSGSFLKLSPAGAGGSHKLSSFAALRAKITWPRRYSKGRAIVRCERNEAQFVLQHCYDLRIGNCVLHCALSTKEMDCIVIEGLDRDTSESEILEYLQMVTGRRFLDVFLIRGEAVNNAPSLSACEDAILKEIAPFMPNQAPLSNYCHVQVFSPNPMDTFMKARITFDGTLHLEAAKALQHIQGKVLAGCFSWQKMQCERKFHSSISCPAPVFAFIERQLDSLLERFTLRPGVRCSVETNANGSYRVTISANATKIVAELRRPLEQLMNGKTVDHGSLSPAVVQLLFSGDCRFIMRSLQQETGTCIFFDRHSLNVRIYGPENKTALAEKKLIQSLLSLHDKKQMYIPLRGGVMPHNLMKKAVEKFGPDLHGLKEMFPDTEFTLNTRRHGISLTGKEDLRLKVEDIVHDFARSLSISGSEKKPEFEATSCPICLCEVEECYQLEACAHKFCRPCLFEQLESAMRGRDGFPIRCTYEGCGKHILLVDLKSLLPGDKIDDLFRASVEAFVASSGGKYRFCPSPDCPSVYQVSNSGIFAGAFACGACYVETCTRCHLEYHPYISCERYKMFKDDPDMSLKDWCKGKEHVKSCPVCGFVIEKIDGCNHIECKCGKHVCWACLEFFSSSEDCYGHLREIHQGIQF